MYNTFITEMASPNDFSRTGDYTITRELAGDAGLARVGPFRVPYFAGRPTDRILASIITDSAETSLAADVSMWHSITGNVSDSTRIGDVETMGTDNLSLQTNTFSGEYVHIEVDVTTASSHTITVIIKAS